jgi:hypothetical protein
VCGLRLGLLRAAWKRAMAFNCWVVRDTRDLSISISTPSLVADTDMLMRPIYTAYGIGPFL